MYGSLRPHGLQPARLLCPWDFLEARILEWVAMPPTGDVPVPGIKAASPALQADCDCSHEIKRRLLLGRKDMTNLDSMLKSRDVTLPTKVPIVKAMIFQVIMHWYESWIIKKVEYRELILLNCGAGEDSWESPWTARRSNQSILKEINPEYSLEGLMLKLQYFGHLMQRADSLEKTLMLRKIEGKKRSGQQRMRWLDSITDSMDVKFEQTLGDRGGQRTLVCCSPWGHKE